ncbi:MAG TPA: FHA domain-containing protein [Candidatus Brocadiia bacterium]|nr:FHA domain-containing protein [Candidatus Brocadiia bacterium]
MPVRFRCTKCNEYIEVPSSHYGKEAFCFSCGTKIGVPRPVKHECNKCGRTAVLDGDKPRRCPCGGELRAVQVFESRPMAQRSSVWQVQDIDDMVPKDVGEPSLIILTGPKIGMRVPLKENGEFLIGKATICDLQVNNPLASLRHCKVVNEGGRWRLVNEQDGRPAVLDGEPVPVEAELKDGAIIAVGVDLFAFKIPSR